ncbi:MAG: histidine kinase [Caulobacteraceae bacterium]|nr:histidine kinase [Caulobacteraceae bacterium]
MSLWIAVFIIFTLRSFLNPLNFWGQFCPRLLSSIVGATECLLLSLAYRGVSHLSLKWQLAIGVLASLPASIAYSAVVDWVFGTLTPSPEDAAPYLIKIFNRSQFNIFVFMSWCFAFLATKYAEQSQRNAFELVEAQALAADAQNRMLRYQINPHFLFNTLNALQALLLERRVGQARGVVERLAEFLRYSLARKPEDMVTVREEVDAQQAYLAIEEVRFSDRLTFERRIEPEVESVLVPSLILQPLIENAVKYAVSPASTPVRIELSAYPEGADLVMEVRDDGRNPPKASGLGVGLENISRRLKLIYGGRARFEHGPAAPHGYVARIIVPMAAP